MNVVYAGLTVPAPGAKADPNVPVSGLQKAILLCDPARLIGSTLNLVRQEFTILVSCHPDCILFWQNFRILVGIDQKARAVRRIDTDKIFRRLQLHVIRCLNGSVKVLVVMLPQNGVCPADPIVIAVVQILVIETDRYTSL